MFRRSRKAEQRKADEPPILTVHFGDMHIGSSVALCPPEVQTDDGGTHLASPLSAWYWECWYRFWEDTAGIKKREGAHCVAICGGDERDGDHHQTIQLWSASETDQDKAVMQALAVAAQVADEWVFIRGTPAHDGPGAAATERYARQAAALGWSVRRHGERHSFWCWTGILGGVKFEVAHAPGTKSWVPHTRAPATARHATYTWLEYMEDGIEPPDVVVRHHVHYAAGPGCHESTCCFIVPGWQAATEHVNRRGVVSARAVRRPGGLRLLCQGGAYKPVDPKWFKLYRPRSSVAWCPVT